MRVMIVDDEEPARDRLRQMLEALPDCEVIGEAEDGDEAIERIGQLHPDLVLLDIQMPGCGGIEVAGSLPSPRPRIIFCTAFDQYAVDAFDLHAVDYLLKPVNRVRLTEAINRARNATTLDVDASLDATLRSPGMWPRRFLARRNSRFRVIPQEEVVYFGLENGLTKLYTRDQNYVMEPTLNDFERRLDPALFYRVSRTAIVNVNWVEEVASLLGGYGELTLRTGTRLEVSRRRFKDLITLLEGSVK